MKIFYNTYEYDIKKLGLDRLGCADLPLCSTLFFDIETTGFSASHSVLYLIGCMYYDSDENIFKTIQWFNDNKDSEELILNAFFDFTKDFTHIVHFNGNGFDIPYITHKCEFFNIACGFDSLISVDIYKTAAALKKILKLSDFKQKTIEQFLNISRDDRFSGRELIKVYENYLSNGEASLLALLLLHNLDDIKGTLSLLEIFNYSSIFKGGYSIEDVACENNEVIITSKLYYPLSSRISAAFDAAYMTAYGNTLKLRIKIYTEELKFFYPNYKDYYFLPEEDCAIHKSVAFYVDKNFRTKAKAANCYCKKTGSFLPQYKELITPYFKREYNDKITYFEMTDAFLNTGDAVKQYSLHILNAMM